MRINFSAPLYSLLGKPFAQEDGSPLSLYWPCVEALLSPDQAANGVERMHRYMLAKSIMRGGPVEVTSEEVTRIKQQVERVFPSVDLYGAIHEALEGPQVFEDSEVPARVVGP